MTGLSGDERVKELLQRQEEEEKRRAEAAVKALKALVELKKKEV